MLDFCGSDFVIHGLPSIAICIGYNAAYIFPSCTFFAGICCTFPLAFASTYAVFRRHVSRRLVAPEAHRFLPPGLFCVLAGFCGDEAFIVFCRLQVSSNLSIRRNVARKSCYVSFIFAFENDMYNVRVACKH